MQTGSRRVRTVLHIGMAKTGSTALQDCLSRSREYLLTRGVLYPKNPDGLKFNNHRLLVQPLLEYRKLPPSMRRNAGPEELEARHESFVATARKQVEETKPECLLLSSEHLFNGFSGDRAELVLKDLEAMGADRDVEVVVYIRRPSEHFLSLCQQGLRTSHRVRQPSPPNYRRPLRRASRLFGRKSVKVRLFNRAHMVDGDIVSDFCAAFLSPEGIARDRLEDVSRANESVGTESMDILWRYRTKFDGEKKSQYTPGSNQLFQALCFAEETVGVTRPKLNPAIADLIDYSSDQLSWLRDRFGIEFPGFDYDRLEREGPVESPDREFTLEEMVEIDPDIRAALLREIGTSWASENEGRKAWVDDLLNAVASA